MQALVKREDAPGLWLEDVPEPTVAARDVLIKVDRTGICGTDLHIYKWDDWARKTVPVPLVVGHEFVGEIVEIGSDVKDFSVGEIVSGEGHWKMYSFWSMPRTSSIRGMPRRGLARLMNTRAGWIAPHNLAVMRFVSTAAREVIGIKILIMPPRAWAQCATTPRAPR